MPDDRDGAPRQGVVLSLGPEGARIIAKVEGDDARSLAFLTDGAVEPVGKLGHNRRSADAMVWTAA